MLKFNKRLAITVLAILICACTQDGSDDSGDSGSATSSLTLIEKTYNTSSNESGETNIDLEIKTGDTSAQLSVSGAEYYQLTSITLPSGKDISNLTSYTAAAFQSSPFILNLPLTTEQLSAGTYKISLQNKSSSGRDITGVRSMSVKSLLKKDITPGNGVLKINMIMYGPVANSEDLRTDIENAVGNWRQIYDRAGIQLDVKWYDFDGGATLPDPRFGSPIYETISNATRKQAVNIILASNINGLTENSRFGLTSRSPGPALPSSKSVVAISVLTIAGRDGRLDDNSNSTTQRHSDEVRLTAEVMAQLTAHYLGLDFIVQLSGNRVTSVDNLSDTASCLTVTDCKLNSDARHNFMFPELLRKPKEQGEVNEQNEFYARDQITAQQAMVMNASPLVE